MEILTRESDCCIRQPSGSSKGCSAPLDPSTAVSFEMDMFSTAPPVEINNSVRSISFGSILSGGLSRDQMSLFPDVSSGLMDMDDLFLMSSPKGNLSISSDPISNFQCFPFKADGDSASERFPSLPLDFPAMEAASRFPSIKDLEPPTVITARFSTCITNSSSTNSNSSSSSSTSFCTSIKEEEGKEMEEMSSGLVSTSCGFGIVDSISPSHIRMENRGGLLQSGSIRNLPVISLPQSAVQFPPLSDKDALFDATTRDLSTFSLFDDLGGEASPERTSGFEMDIASSINCTVATSKRSSEQRAFRSSFPANSFQIPPAMIVSDSSSNSSSISPISSASMTFSDEWEMEPKTCRRQSKNRKKWKCTNCTYRNNLSMCNHHVILHSSIMFHNFISIYSYMFYLILSYLMILETKACLNCGMPSPLLSSKSFCSSNKPMNGSCNPTSSTSSTSSSIPSTQSTSIPSSPPSSPCTPILSYPSSPDIFMASSCSSPSSSSSSSSSSSVLSSCSLSSSVPVVTIPADVISFDPPSLCFQPSDLADPADPVHTSKAIQQFGEDAEVGGGYTLKDFPYAHIPPEIGKNATLQEVANVGNLKYEIVGMSVYLEVNCEYCNSHSSLLHVNHAYVHLNSLNSIHDSHSILF